MGPGDGGTFAEEQEHDALDALRWHWDTAYDIDVGDDRWTAKRRDGLGTLEGSTPEELEALIMADYRARRVPR